MAKKKRRKKAGRPRGSGSKQGLSSASMADLQAELERREADLAELIDRREELHAELNSVENDIAALGGSPTRRGPGRPRGTGRRGPGRPAGVRKKTTRRSTGKRPRNKTNLVDALKGVLAGTTMSVTDVAEAVQKAGYRTSSDNFRTIVNQTLLANPKAFKKVARGQYTAK
jgi:hypothetical protein